mmetsp:Transcript_42171/g.78426  ORF Transcript_42171/g.78426 Transcript_42171/m.78426 type:complete len:173 (-) Transcript_42171:132-650(-)
MKTMSKGGSSSFGSCPSWVYSRGCSCVPTMAAWQAQMKTMSKGGWGDGKSGGKGWGGCGGGKGGMMMMAALMKGMKGKGKGKNPNRGKGHTLPRERISESPLIGEVLEWKGKYGWLKPQEPIEHAKAGRHGGKIFVSQADLVGVQELTVGRLCQFQLFEDSSGLGAEEVLQA